MIHSFQPLTPAQRLWRGILLRILSGLESGRLVLHDADGRHEPVSSDPRPELTGEIFVNDPAFYAAAIVEQSAGVGRAFMSGWWQSPDVVKVIRVLARNEGVLRRWTAPTQGILAAWHRLALWARRNNLPGARRNISAHYDQGEDFFSRFLDRTLTYSCAWFDDRRTDLHAAQTAKLDLACRKLDLQPEDHVLEIGTGWGSFAIHAASRYGCRVTTTTISARQAAFARERVKELGLDDRITVVQQDYRELEGRYDKLVSLEMIEAVGVRWYPTYFRRCAELLRENGAMLLQAIVVDDRHFRHDARHVDFIKKYIFPGGVLPSISVIARTVARHTDLQVGHLQDMTAHYARTLEVWRQRLLMARDELRDLGRSEAFLRCWEFYFAYCEGGFRERRIGTVQMLLAKQQCRSLSLLQVAAPAVATVSSVGTGNGPSCRKGEA